MSQDQNITAVLYDKRGRVLSIGKNSYVKTHTKMARAAASVGMPHKKYLHAEADAIFKCAEIHRAHRIFISRVMKDGSYGLAKPCPICEKIIREAGIKVIEHT